MTLHLSLVLVCERTGWVLIYGWVDANQLTTALRFPCTRLREAATYGTCGDERWLAAAAAAVIASAVLGIRIRPLYLLPLSPSDYHTLIITVN